jgi:hypothetical protein
MVYYALSGDRMFDNKGKRRRDTLNDLFNGETPAISAEKKKELASKGWTFDDNGKPRPPSLKQNPKSTGFRFSAAEKIESGNAPTPDRENRRDTERRYSPISSPPQNRDPFNLKTAWEIETAGRALTHVLKYTM